MKKSILKLTLASAVLGSFLSLGSFTARAETIRIDGSSTVYPITEAVAEEFQKIKKGAVRVTVGIAGTGGGFKKFCRGEIDVSNASRPILKKEMDDCYMQGIKFIEVPIAYDALTVVIHPSNTWATTMTVAELKKIWEPGAQGIITKWNQVRPEWPDKPIKLYGAGSDSGTFDYFTEAIVGKTKSSRGDYTASEDDNVLVQGVANDPNALGYFGYAYYSENQSKVKAVAINAKAAGVLPSPETVINGTYIPLARPIFIYISAKSLSKPDVKEFVNFYLKNAPTLSKQVKYIPLPAAAYAHDEGLVQNAKVGTAFGGSPQVGLKIEEIMSREPKL